jgi:hypothetical protein
MLFLLAAAALVVVAAIPAHKVQAHHLLAALLLAAVMAAAAILLALVVMVVLAAAVTDITAQPTQISPGGLLHQDKVMLEVLVTMLVALICLQVEAAVLVQQVVTILALHQVLVV